MSSAVNNVQVRICGTKKDPVLKSSVIDDANPVIKRRDASLYDQNNAPQPEVSSFATRDRNISHRLTMRLKPGELALIKTGQVLQVIGYQHPQLHRMVGTPEPYVQYVIQYIDTIHSGDLVVNMGLVRKDRM